MCQLIYQVPNLIRFLCLYVHKKMPKNAVMPQSAIVGLLIAMVCDQNFVESVVEVNFEMESELNVILITCESH